MAPASSSNRILHVRNTTDWPLSIDLGHVSLAPFDLASRSSAHLALPPSVRLTRPDRLELKIGRGGEKETLALLRKRQGWKTGKVEAWTTTVPPIEDSSSNGSQATLVRPSWDLSAFYNKKSRTLVFISNPPLNSWMAPLPDSTFLADLSLPGTHQSTALYGFPVSQCQQPSTPLGVQLQEGIRFLDVRLAEKKGKLIAYHGILTQRANFEDLLAQVQTFLTTPESSRETVIMSIQQENASTPLFLALLRSYISLSPSFWFLANRIPRLAEVRGKIVLFSRFGTAADEREWEAMGGMGIHPEGWRDSVKEGFEVDLPRGEKEGMGWTLGIQDWYNIHSVLSIPEKTLAVQTLLSTQTPLSSHFPIAFCSAASFPFAMPYHVARGFGLGWMGMGVEGVNSRMRRWLVDRLASEGGGEEGKEGTASLKGAVLVDFYRSEEGLVDLLVAFNFR